MALAYEGSRAPGTGYVYKITVTGTSYHPEVGEDNTQVELMIDVYIIPGLANGH